MNEIATSYYLTWKGGQTGPFTLEQIRAQLITGEISRVHQIGVGGGWQLLDEFLSRLPEEKAAREAAASRSSLENRWQPELPRGLAPEPAGSPAPDETEGNSPLRHLLPKAPPQPAADVAAESPDAEPFPEDYGPMRTSNLAVACLVLSFGCFIPYVQLVSWLLALVCGHTALIQMKRDPALGGRGLAIAGLVITYFLLVMATTVLVLFLYHGLKLPEYYRL